jgi:hypothetical protein
VANELSHFEFFEAKLMKRREQWQSKIKTQLFKKVLENRLNSYRMRSYNVITLLSPSKLKKSKIVE